MAASVPRQEDDLAASQFSGQVLIRRFAEGGFDSNPLLGSEAFEVIKPAAANDADAICRHSYLLLPILRRNIRNTATKGRFLRQNAEAEDFRPRKKPGQA